MISVKLHNVTSVALISLSVFSVSGFIDNTNRNLTGFLFTQTALSAESACRPPEINKLIDKAWQAYSGKLYQHSEQLWRQLLENCPRNETGILYLGYALEAQGWLDDARLKYEELIGLNSSSAEAYNALGSVFRQQKQYKKSVDSYRKAIQLEPKDAKVWHRLGNSLYSLEDYNGAIEVYQQAIKIDGKSIYSYVAIGNSLRQQGKLEEAIDFYKRAIQVAPSDSWAYESWAYALSQQERLPEAIEVYRKAFAVADNTCDKVDILYGLGDAHRKSANLNQAQQTYREAFNSSPECADRIPVQGQALSSQNLLILQFQGILKKMSPNQPINNNSGFSNLSNSKGSQRIAQLNELYQIAIPLLSISTPNPFNNLGDLGAVHKRKLEEFVLKNPDLSEAHAALGIVFFLEDQLSLANQSFEKAILLDKGQPLTEASFSFTSFTSILGTLLIAHGQRSSVLLSIEQVASAESNKPDPKTLLLYASLFNQLDGLGRSLEAKAILAHVYGKYPDNVYVLLAKTAEASREKNYSQTQIYADQVRVASKFLRGEEAIVINSVLPIVLAQMNSDPHSTFPTPQTISDEQRAKCINNIGRHVSIQTLMTECFTNSVPITEFPKNGISPDPELMITFLQSLLSTSEFSRLSEHPQMGSLLRTQMGAMFEALGTRGSQENATNALRKIAKSDPNNPILQILAGRALLNVSNFRDSISSLTLALEQRSQISPDLSSPLEKSLFPVASKEYAGTVPPYQENVSNTPEARLKRSIVAVLPGSEVSTEDTQGIGSGVVIHRDGKTIYILTARHVLFNEKNMLRNSDFRVEFYSEPKPKQQRLRLYAEVVPQSANNPNLDLILLKVYGGVPDDIKPLGFSPSSLNQEIALKAIGHPGMGERWSVAQVFPVERTSEQDLQISLPQSLEGSKAQGFSGGPIVNNSSKIVGIISKTQQDSVKGYSVLTIESALRNWKVF